VAEPISVGDVKRHFSEVLSRVQFRRQRYVVERRGKPVAAVVSVDDLERLEPEKPSPKGFLALVGAWADYPDMDAFVSEVYASRRRAKDRPAPRLGD